MSSHRPISRRMRNMIARTGDNTVSQQNVDGQHNDSTVQRTLSAYNSLPPYAPAFYTPLPPLARNDFDDEFDAAFDVKFDADSTAPAQQIAPPAILPPQNIRRMSVYAQEPTIQIIVGTSPTTTTFNLHPTLLKTAFQYFSACLSGNFSETTNKKVSLTDINPTHFALFVDWLGDYDSPSRLSEEECINLALLGDRLLCESVQEGCITALRNMYKLDATKETSTELLKLICDNTPAGEAPLRKFYVDAMALQLRDELMRVQIMTQEGWADLEATVVTEILGAWFLRYDEAMCMGRLSGVRGAQGQKGIEVLKWGEDVGTPPDDLFGFQYTDADDDFRTMGAGWKGRMWH